MDNISNPLKADIKDLTVLAPDPNEPIAVEVLSPMVCHVCKRLLPQTAMNWRLNKEGRVNTGNMCLKCAANANRRSLLKAATQELLISAKKNQLAVPHISEIAVGMVEKFDGVENLCNEWYQQIQMAKDGSKVRLDQYMALVKLIQASSEEADRQVRDLTDAELEAEAAPLLDRMISHMMETKDASERATTD